MLKKRGRHPPKEAWPKKESLQLKPAGSKDSRRFP
jgi:hypothetical protein